MQQLFMISFWNQAIEQQKKIIFIISITFL